jgi:hypothetical protein
LRLSCLSHTCRCHPSPDGTFRWGSLGAAGRCSQHCFDPFQACLYALGAVPGARRVRDAYDHLAKALRKVYVNFLLFLETFLNTYKIFLYSLLIGVFLIFLILLSSILICFFPEGVASLILRRAVFSHIHRARHVGRSRLKY